MRETAVHGTQSLGTTLLACRLIVSFQTYHCNHKATLSQIQVGLRLMDGWLDCASPSTDIYSSGKVAIQEQICESSDRLAIQVMFFPDTRSRYIHQAMMNCNPDAMNTIPRTFTTIKAARFCADITMR